VTSGPAPVIRPRRRRRRPSVVKWLVLVAIALALFAVGVAFGQALEDRPQPAKPLTNVTTIQPWTQTGGNTVTVTVTQP
jgi:hypothetical protein